MTTTVLIGLALGLGAPALKEPPGAEANIVGEWVVESTYYGSRLRLLAGEPLRYEFTADGRWVVYRGGVADGEKRSYTIDAKASPWRIDLRSDPDAPLVRGIYKVEGDKLTLCYARDAGDPRPTEFAAERKSTAILYVLKRAKKE